MVRHRDLFVGVSQIFEVFEGGQHTVLNFSDPGVEKKSHILSQRLACSHTSSWAVDQDTNTANKSMNVSFTNQKHRSSRTLSRRKLGLYGSGAAAANDDVLGDSG
jgi:hypothetical protein